MNSKNKNLIKIRPIKETDLKILSEIYTKIYSDLNIGEKWTIESSLALFKYWKKKQKDLFLVAEIGSKIVGAIMGGIKPWWNGNHLVDAELFVQKEYQKLKIGSKLLKEILEISIKKYSITQLDAVTYNDYEHPWKWYENLGFNKVENLFLFEGEAKTILKNIKSKENSK